MSHTHSRHHFSLLLSWQDVIFKTTFRLGYRQQKPFKNTTNTTTTVNIHDNNNYTNYHNNINNNKNYL